MKKYIDYFKYVIKHKFYVFLECWKVGLFWQGVVHDLSKFYPSEFIPYARHFYGRTGLPAVDESHKTQFELAFLKHLHRNPHHWQFWILPEYSGGDEKLFPMPEKYVREMICDWRGVSRAIEGKDNTVAWYSGRKDVIRLHPSTLKLVHSILGIPLGRVGVATKYGSRVVNKDAVIIGTIKKN